MKMHEDNEETEKEAEHEDTMGKRVACKGCKEDGHAKNHHKHKSMHHKKEAVKKAMEKAKK